MLKNTTKISLEEERGSIRLQENLWEGGGCLTEEEAMSLIKPFI
jgi:hypothetical protein